MKKSERLNDMIRYLNNLEYFNLQDLMTKYNISKSTALRDISSLEQLGMPIFFGAWQKWALWSFKKQIIIPHYFFY